MVLFFDAAEQKKEGELSPAEGRNICYMGRIARRDALS